MNSSHPTAPVFRLRPLALLLAMIYVPSSFAAAGRIEFSTSEPVVKSSDGRERPARKGEAILPGERVLTRSGRAQIAFTDGGFVSLQPNTEFGVEEYEFKGSNDGSEKSVFSLIKGALRTVTGFIGRSKRDAYTMRTPTATIGIRGTGGRIEVNDDGTLIQGSSGTWSLTNKAGTLDVPAGTGGFAGTDPNKAPERTSKTPSTASFGTEGKFELPPTYSAGDQLGALTLGMANGPGYKVAYVDPGDLVAYLDGPATATFNGGISLLSAGGVSIGTAQAVEAWNDGIIGWGRWSNGTVNTSGGPANLTANQGLHYVVGIPTATMPTTGSASYTVLGSTSPTLVSGSAAPGSLVSASLNVNFATTTLGYALQVSVGGFIYNTSNTGVSFTGSTFSDVSPYTTLGSGCAGSGCQGTVKGVFTGTDAARAGLSYKIYSDTMSENIVGAVTFKK